MYQFHTILTAERLTCALFCLKEMFKNANFLTVVMSQGYHMMSNSSKLILLKRHLNGLSENVYMFVPTDKTLTGFDVSFETPIYSENGVAHSIRNGIGTQGVKPVGMPTDWVSSLVVVKKPNGKVKSIHQPKTAQQYKCRHYPLPIIDDLVKGQSFHHV